jgi:hypothetical protein
VRCITAQIESGDLENGISRDPEYSGSLLSRPLSLKCVLMHEVAVILYAFKYRKSQRSEGGVQGVPPWENKEFKERGSIRSLRIKDFLLTLLRILVRSKLALFPASGAAPGGVRGWPLKSKSKLLQAGFTTRSLVKWAIL